MEVVVQAPAKINLTLDITGKLKNGHHTVDMVMQAVSLYDYVTVSESSNEIRLTCNKKDIPCDDTNTAYKAAQAFFDYAKISGGTSIHLEKSIPKEAGLAGGSTDAAAVLVGLNTVYETDYGLEVLAKIGAQIGADVPFCLYGATMHATGTGTQLKNARVLMPGFSIVICKPDEGVCTKEAYSLADKSPYTKDVHSAKCLTALRNADLWAFASAVHNDFEQILELPEVERIKKSMCKSGALCAAMSGSGAAVFGIFTSKDNASVCASRLKMDYDEVFVTEPVNWGCKIIKYR